MTRKATAPRRPSKALELSVPHPTMPHVRMWHLRLPRLRLPHLPVPRMPMPPMPPLPSMPRIDMNERAGKVMWYGGLAALAVLGVIEWPVAAVVAAGSYVAERRAAARSNAQRRTARHAH
jgi:hypothetical protein